MNWWEPIAEPVKGAAKYVVNRFARLARLELVVPQHCILPCLMVEGGLAVGAVPEVLESPEPAVLGEGLLAMQCLVLAVLNHGWEKEATNCFLKTTYVGAQAVPVSTYCLTSPSEFATVPHKGERQYVICLVDTASSEAVFCTWAAPKARNSGDPVWQFRVPLGQPMQLTVKLEADNAPTRKYGFTLKIGTERPHDVSILAWNAARTSQRRRRTPSGF